MCAGSSATFCGAWLQRNVKRGPGGHRRSEMAEAFNLSVIAARSPVVSFCDDSIVNDKNCQPRDWGSSDRALSSPR